MSTRVFKFLIVLVGGVAVGTLTFSWWAAASTPPSTTVLAVETTTTTTPTTTLPPTTTTTIPPTTTTTEEPRGTLVIQGTGDVAVDPWYIPTFLSEGWDHAWTGLDGVFLEDDLTVINLECVPSDIGEPLDKAFTFRCPTTALPSIRRHGIDVGARRPR